jgi:putative phosphoesterase
MRLGLISDIHGNLWAFKRALQLLKNQDVDQIICAGDLVERNPQGNEVVELIQQEDIPTVQGNHDKSAQDNQRWLEKVNTLMPEFGGHAETLNDDTLKFLEQLPKTRRFDFEGKALLLAHATPWDQSTYIFPQGNNHLFYRIGQEAGAKMVVLGHTHAPMAVRVRKYDVYVFNPGSVGDQRYQHGLTCAIVNLPEFSFQFYNVESGEAFTVPLMKV